MLDELKAKVTNSHVFFLRGPLSQWYPSHFVSQEKITFTCCEQYMMWRKAHLFGDVEASKKIMATNSPAIQKKLGRKVSGFDEEKWQAHREDVVYEGNLYKFTCNSHLRELLLATDDRTLVEVNPKDSIWGIGLSVNNSRIYDESQWRGLNLLGKTLMRVRNTIKEQQNGHA